VNSVQIVSAMIAVIGLLIFIKLTRPLQIFVVYLIVAACTELLSFVFANKSMPNLYFLHAFTLMEFWFITIFFHDIVKSISNRVSLYSILFLGQFAIITNSIIIQGVHEFNTYSASFVSIIIILMSLMYFYSILDNIEEKIEQKTIKWFVIGLFFYHCVSLIVLIFSNQVISSTERTQTIIWTARVAIILSTKLIFFFALLNFSIQYIKNVIKNKELI
jgi:hypothetical protein